MPQSIRIRDERTPRKLLRRPPLEPISKGALSPCVAMRSSTLEIRTPDGVADAYLAKPEEGERHPGVLFVMDAYGLRPRIEEMADRIAEHGYAVLAPNVFYRAGRAPVLPFPDMSREGARAEFFKSVRPLMNQLTPERVAADGDAYLDELAKVADEPFAIAGYCMGARADRHRRCRAGRGRSQTPLRGLRRSQPRLHDGRHAGV